MFLPPPEHIRHRPEPRFSANELAKYMMTLGPGKIGIIAKARDSATIPQAYYSDLRTGLKGFLTSPLRDGGLLDTLGNTLEQRANDTSVSNFRRQEAQLSLGALEAFQRLGKNRLAGYNFLPAPRRQEPLPSAVSP